MSFFRSLAIAFLLTFSSGGTALSQLNVREVAVIEAPSNYIFVDMGYDLENDEVAIVGSVDNGTEILPTVFELNASQDAFTAQTLADLPGATDRAEVFGISSDASRIAGSSTSSNAIDLSLIHI